MKHVPRLPFGRLVLLELSSAGSCVFLKFPRSGRLAGFVLRVASCPAWGNR